MNTILKKLSIILLLTIIILSAFSLSSKAISSNILNNEKDLIAPNMSTSEIIPLNSNEEKIMEYDAKTGTTREVNIDELHKSISLKNSKNKGYNNRIEPYDPLNYVSQDVATTYSDFNQVSEVMSLPYRATCRIKADVYGNELVGSGYLAGPKVVVTAAHCVMNMDDNDNLFADWVAYPGYNNGRSYNDVSSGWSKIYYSSNWKSTHSPAYDWAICVLNSDIGNTTGWWGTYSYGSNSAMNNISVRLYGYPLDLARGALQYYSTGTISDTQNEYFYSSAKAIGGFSGGPYARTSDNYVVGICHGYRDDNNNISIGVRITQEMVDIILENS